jgi:cell division septation protein DedD
MSIVLFLVVVAFIWHVNPWPSLKAGIEGLFSSSSPKPVEADIDTAKSVSANEAAPELRAWDFFVQVSSWQQLGQADLDAERYRAQNFDVMVESEFITRKGGTWYRVRLGPYESSAAARGILMNNAAILPKGAYLDSVRLGQDQPTLTPPPPKAAAAGRRDGPRDASESGGSQRQSGRDFDVIDEPMSGWAVKVSSLKTEDMARKEARKVLAQGYPSFITRKNIGGTNWYRVLVGPFSDKRDADKYQQLLNVTYGNDAYTVDLSAD